MEIISGKKCFTCITVAYRLYVFVFFFLNTYFLGSFEIVSTLYSNDWLFWGCTCLRGCAFIIWILYIFHNFHSDCNLVIEGVFGGHARSGSQDQYYHLPNAGRYQPHLCYWMTGSLSYPAALHTPILVRAMEWISIPHLFPW